MDQEKPKIEKAEEEKSPISEGEMFFPELELKDVKALSSKERKDALDRWKEKYVYQKEGFAKMQEDFVSQIRENPDIPLEDLNKNLDEWGAKYGFTPQQKKIAEAILQEYEQKHQAVSKYRKEYPDDAELFEVMFGVKPQGKVEIVEGPITLYVKCYHLEDYTLIYSQAFLNGRVLTAKDIDSASDSSGVSIKTSLIQELAGTIIAQKAVGKNSDKDHDRIFVHEEQHAIRRLFKEIPQREGFFADFMEAAMNNNDEKIKSALSRFFRSFREEGEASAKNEILAYLKSRYDAIEKTEVDASLRGIFETITNVEKERSYNYFDNTRKQLREIFFQGKYTLGEVIYKDLHFGENEALKQKIQSFFEQADKQIFEDEYKQIVWEGLNVYKALQDGGYSQEQTIALLINEPLIKWPKVASRLLGKFKVIKRERIKS